MKEIILAIVGVACLLAGWGWHMSPRWFRLLCRTLTIYCLLAILVILGWNWLTPYYKLLIIPFIAVPLGFFWELIPVSGIRTNLLTVWRVLAHIDESKKLLGFSRIREATELLSIKDEQKAHPEQWLYPVVQYIDLNRQGGLQNDNDAWVSFQIDSHLLFSVKEFYVSVQLCLKDTDDHEETQSDWQSIPLPDNHAPIGCLERYRFGEVMLHFEQVSKTQDNTMLLELMERFRHGKQIHAELKVGIRFDENDRLDSHILKGNTPSFDINPINNYRGG